jgi:hypothetical protein
MIRVLSGTDVEGVMSLMAWSVSFKTSAWYPPSVKPYLAELVTSERPGPLSEARDNSSKTVDRFISLEAPACSNMVRAMGRTLSKVAVGYGFAVQPRRLVSAFSLEGALARFLPVLRPFFRRFAPLFLEDLRVAGTGVLPLADGNSELASFSVVIGSEVAVGFVLDIISPIEGL